MTYNAPGENAVKKWKTFKTYFGCSDQYKPVSKSKEALNRKVQPMLDQIHEVSKATIHMRCNESADDHHCNFKGNHMDKTHVKFKRGGDGYLNDSLC